MSSNRRTVVTPAGVKVKANVRATAVYPRKAKSVSLIFSKRAAKEFARNLLMVAFGKDVRDIIVTGYRDGHVTSLGRLQRPARATGIVDAIRALLEKASQENPTSRAAMLEVLVEQFEQQDRRTVGNTLSWYLSWYFPRHAQGRFHRNEKGYWLAA
jgi:hypothetical protein